MSAITLDEIRQDELAMSVATALAKANATAIANGVRPAETIVTIAEEASSDGRHWRINYMPKDFLNRRGGDLIVLVDEQQDAAPRVMFGQ